GGLPSTTLFEERAPCPGALSAWEVIGGEIKPEGAVLIHDEAGDHAGLTAAEIAAAAGAEVELITPDRAVAPEVMGMNLVPYMRALLEAGVRITPGQRLRGLRREGNRLLATIGSDYTARRWERGFDMVVVNYGTTPNDALYHALRPLSRNLGAVDNDALAEGRPQALTANPEGRFRLWRIGDAVASRNVHAAILDALRLMKDV
ncbi:MAG: N-methylproline demethylase, partial [Alphaproteobacteria bacterium]